MIVGLIVTGLGVIGVTGFFTGNLTLVAIGGIASLVEVLIRLYTGEIRSVTSVIIGAIVGVIYASAAGLSIWLGVVIGLCFESAISGVLSFAVIGWIMTNSRNEE